MTEENKQLLLRDLCARQPYKVKISVDDDNLFIPTLKYIDGIICYFYECAWTKYIGNIKPYLRPMSSMTEDEREEWADLFNLELDKLNEIDDENKAEELAPYYFGKSHQVSIDWLNTHYFDYRGLIEKGLAIEAPKNMYNTKTE